MEKTVEYQMETHLLCVEFHKAFDTIKRTFIFMKLFRKPKLYL